MSTYKADDRVWEMYKKVAHLINGREQHVLNNYVIENENDLNHPLIVEELLFNVEMTLNFYYTNTEYFNAVIRILQKTDYSDSKISLRSAMRVELFKMFVEDDLRTHLLETYNHLVVSAKQIEKQKSEINQRLKDTGMSNGAILYKSCKMRGQK